MADLQILVRTDRYVPSQAIVVVNVSDAEFVNGDPEHLIKSFSEFRPARKLFKLCKMNPLIVFEFEEYVHGESFGKGS